MKTILSVIITILAAMNLRHEYKIKDLESKTIDAFRILCNALFSEDE